MHTTEPNQYALSFPTVVAFMIGMKKVSGNYAQSRRICYQDEKGRRVGIYVLLNCLPTPPTPFTRVYHPPPRGPSHPGSDPAKDAMMQLGSSNQNSKQALTRPRNPTSGARVGNGVTIADRHASRPGHKTLGRLHTILKISKLGFYADHDPNGTWIHWLALGGELGGARSSVYTTIGSRCHYCIWQCLEPGDSSPRANVTPRIAAQPRAKFTTPYL